MKRILTGYQPSGELTLGNYLGSIKNLIDLQSEHETFVFIANLHSVTIPKEKKELKKYTIDLAKMLIACGVDTSKSTLFVQSDIMELAQLSYLLTCNTSVDELKNMTQFKDKSKTGVKMENGTTMVPTGLFVYPPVMAADILAFQADLVPVGDDQKQHLELTATIAKRMNTRYGDIFKIPEGYFKKESSRVMSLVDPTKKMSKSSDNAKSFILLSDDPKTASKKIMSAVTDSEGKVYYDKDNKAGVSNLIEIYAGLRNLSIAEAENTLNSLDYKELKESVAKEVVSLLEGIQSNYSKISDEDLVDLLKEGAQKAGFVARKTLEKTKNKTGVNYVKR